MLNPILFVGSSHPILGIIVTWHDLNTIKLIYRHTVTTCLLIGCYKLISLWGDFGLEDPFNKYFIQLADRMLFVGIILWWVYQLAVELWNRRIRIRRIKGVLALSALAT
jgi:hypothetical protein